MLRPKKALTVGIWLHNAAHARVQVTMAVTDGTAIEGTNRRSDRHTGLRSSGSAVVGVDEGWAGADA